MDEASKRVTGVLDEFQKKQDDFVLDAMIKTGGGALVGLSLGVLTKRLVRVRSTVFAGTCLGLGMSVERYSQQLSAPYVSAPDCEVAARPPMFKGTFREHLPSFLQPEVLTTMYKKTPKEETATNEAEVTAEPVAEEAVVEVVEPVVTEEAAQVSIVDAVAAELKKELHEAAAEVETVAQEVEVAAHDVDAAAEVVENVAEKAEVVFAQAEEVVEVAQTIEHVAEQVEQVAENVAEVAEEVKEATE